MNLLKIGAAGLAVALTAIIVPATASAENPVIVEAVIDRPVIYVSYADLDLSDKAGVTRLNRRVHKAASRLCIQDGPQPLGEEMLDRECRAETLAAAAPQIETAVANFGNSQYAAASGQKIAVALR